MSADMLIATLACPTGTPIDFDAGRAAVNRVTDPDEFWHTDDSMIEHLIPDFDPEIHLDPSTSQPTLQAMAKAGRGVIDDLERALTDDADITERIIGGYTLYLSGGLSYGDAPTEAADVIWNVDILPTSVLRAMNITLDYSQPPARKNGSNGPITDTDVVDAIQLGLATQSEWSGGDCLEWITGLIANVRSEPDPDTSPKGQLAAWIKEFDFDPTEDSFLTMYVDEEADEDIEETA